MNKTKFYLFLLAALINYLIGSTQNFSDNWEGHFAYLNFVDIAVAEERIYIAAENSLFVHDTQTNVNKEFTTVEGLSGENISALHYSDSKKMIVVGYENGLVDIIDEISGKVNTLVDIRNQLGILPTAIKVNDFSEDSELLYIATGFGIVEYNLNRNLFEDTYRISNNAAIVSDVKSVHVFGDLIFASIAGRGTFTGNKGDFNLIQFENWNLIQPEVFTDIVTFSDQVVAHNSGRNLFRYNGTTFITEFVSTENIKDFRTNNSLLSLTGSTKFTSLNANLSLNEEIIYGTENGLNDKINISLLINNEIYFSNEGNGFYKTSNKNFSNPQVISPAGPASNSVFALDAFEGDLWMVYGAVSESFNPGGRNANLGPTSFSNSIWKTFDRTQFDGGRVLSNVKINRNNKEQVYVGSFRFGGGLYEINNKENITLYNEKNSNIELSELQPGFISVFTMEFDSNNSLWIINSEIPNFLKRFEKGENNLNISVNYENFINSSQNLTFFNINEIIIDENDNIYLGTVRDGVLGYQINTEKRAAVTSEQLGFPFFRTRTLALDFNNELWIGGSAGLRVISDPERMFQNNANIEGEAIIILQEGIPQELLFQQSITDIKIDASNNKWVATSGAGVFYFSPDGQETILNFTAENSPLPSNNINDMALDESKGVIYFATDKGLVEYKTDVTAPEVTLEKLKIFPNPVRPEYGEVNVKIRGLTSGANVKITDIEGNLVFEVQNETFGGESSGSVSWNTRSFSGRKVASGVYLVLITGEEGEETSVGKILIVR